MSLMSAILKDCLMEIFKWLFPKLFKPYMVCHSFTISDDELENKKMDEFAYESLKNQIKFSRRIEISNIKGKDINGNDVMRRMYKLTLL